MKRIIVDLDNTITSGSAAQYSELAANHALIEQLQRYQEDGFDIVIHTSRGMRSHHGNVGRINVHTLPVILAWLARHKVPHDEVVVGKPWCGHEGFYIDDRAIRPAEFVQGTYAQILEKISAGS